MMSITHSVRSLTAGGRLLFFLLLGVLAQGYAQAQGYALVQSPNVAQANFLTKSEEAFFACPAGYFESLQTDLQIEWPKNRRIHLVFHGHSVPAGYFRTPEVRTFDSYPHLCHVELSKFFPTATIDSSVTAIGGENSASGSQRFEDDVLAIKPDVVFIDYALNDRRLGLEASETAWRAMIDAALKKQVKVVLLTPTPDTREDLLDSESPLAQHAALVRRLADEYDVAMLDSYRIFAAELKNGRPLESLMSQTNHPNRAGHELVAKQIAALLTQTSPKRLPIR